MLFLAVADQRPHEGWIFVAGQGRSHKVSWPEFWELAFIREMQPATQHRGLVLPQLYICTGILANLI